MEPSPGAGVPRLVRGPIRPVAGWTSAAAPAPSPKPSSPQPTRARCWASIPRPPSSTPPKPASADPRASFEVGDARALPVATDDFDAVVAGLVLNFVPDPAPAVAEMARAARPGGLIGAYVWDYRGEMQLLRYFWEAAAAMDPAAAALDPRPHMHTCQPEPLVALFRSAGLGDVAVDAIDLPMRFRDLDDFWVPNTMTGAAVAQRYASVLDADRKAALREQLRITLPTEADGTIDLIGRAWAVRGTKPTHERN